MTKIKINNEIFDAVALKRRESVDIPDENESYDGPPEPIAVPKRGRDRTREPQGSPTTEAGTVETAVHLTQQAGEEKYR